MPRLDIPIIGFQPDVDASTPGVVLEGSGLVPYADGFGPPPVRESSGRDTLADDCTGAAAVRLLDDSSRSFAGTASALYELTGTTWTDRSAGGGYTGTADTPWRFAQFGNLTVACNKVDATQGSSSGAFSALGTNCPKAAICETVAGFVMLLNYNDGVNDYADGWWCSPYQNPSGDWTASIATQAANGRLFDTPGPIRAGRRLGNAMVVYKERSIYMGFYQGPPVIWRWQLIPGDVGALSQEAVIEVNLGGTPMHIFAGYDDFYRFDGTRPVSIGDGVRKWYQSNVPAEYRFRTKLLHDRTDGIVYFCLPDSAGELTQLLAYNYRMNRWGVATSEAVGAVVEYLSPGITYNDLGSFYSTYNTLPDIAYDSPFWTANSPIPAYFNGRILRLFTGTPGASDQNYFIFGSTGDEERYRTVTRVRPRMVGSAPVSGSLFLYHAIIYGALRGPDYAPYNETLNKFDVIRSSHWFKPRFEFTGDFRITAYTYFLEEDGEE